jgi:hypothetical protein
MRIRPVLAVALALGTTAVTGVSAASSNLPYLRSVSASKGHVIAVYQLGDLAPGRIVVAVRSQTDSRGQLLKANVWIGEPLRNTKTAKGLRTRTRHRLAPGRYYVQVSGTVIGVDRLPSNVSAALVERPPRASPLARRNKESAHEGRSP